MEKALENKTFREDLFYRLDVVRLELPPLRERREDIPPLVEYFINKINPKLSIAANTMRLICNYSWPGNIRELANTCSQAAALCDGDTILPEHMGGKILLAYAEKPVLPDQFSQMEGKEETMVIHNLASMLVESGIDRFDQTEEAKLSELLEQLRKLEGEMAAAIRRKGGKAMLPLSLAEAEAKAICEAVGYCQGNIALAARVLGIGRNTLYRKMKMYNIKT